MDAVHFLLMQARSVGAPARTMISERDHLADLVDIVWHGDKRVWADNPWVYRLNQVWLDQARAAVSQPKTEPKGGE